MCGRKFDRRGRRRHAVKWQWEKNRLRRVSCNMSECTRHQISSEFYPTKPSADIHSYYFRPVDSGRPCKVLEGDQRALTGLQGPGKKMLGCNGFFTVRPSKIRPPAKLHTHPTAVSMHALATYQCHLPRYRGYDPCRLTDQQPVLRGALLWGQTFL